MNNVWAYITELLGNGLLWGKSQARFNRAIQKAERDGYHNAAEHIRIMLELRNRVMFEDPEKSPACDGGAKQAPAGEEGAGVGTGDARVRV